MSDIDWKKYIELETQIMNCWNIVDDLKVVTEHVLDHEEATEDTISNVLIGLQHLYQLKFDKLWSAFEDLAPANNLPTGEKINKYEGFTYGDLKHGIKGGIASGTGEWGGRASPDCTFKNAGDLWD